MDPFLSDGRRTAPTKICSMPPACPGRVEKEDRDVKSCVRVPGPLKNTHQRFMDVLQANLSFSAASDVSTGTNLIRSGEIFPGLHNSVETRNVLKKGAFPGLRDLPGGCVICREDPYPSNGRMSIFPSFSCISREFERLSEAGPADLPGEVEGAADVHLFLEFVGVTKVIGVPDTSLRPANRPE